MDTSGGKWSYALVQHPMWLIIAEDGICAERTPPWGCPSLEEYAARLRRGLDALQENPELRLTFDFSAVELEDAAQRFPDLVQAMKELASQRRISFVNGTYSQPHLQMLSVESSIRQFEYGLRSIEALTGCRVRCYAAQEPGITPYLPQVLRALGFASASTPSFPFGIRLTGAQIQHWDRHWEWLRGSDLVDWESPDGSRIPLWLKTSGLPDEAALADEHQHGLLARSRLRVNFPDMMEITPEWIRQRTEICEFVLLEDALDTMTGSCQGTAYLDANYAYCEGVDAEDLSRANAAAESALLTLEAVAALAGSRQPEDLEAEWKQLLKAQHHDAYWTGAPELRAKARSWLADVHAAADSRTEQLLLELGNRLPAPPDTFTILVAGAFAAPHRAPVSVPAEVGRIFDENGVDVPVQSGADGRSVFIAQCDGLGYRSYFGKPYEGRPPSPQAMHSDDIYANGFFSAVISPDASISSLCAVCGGELLDGPGNAWLHRDRDRDVAPVQRSATVSKGPVSTVVSAQCDMEAVILRTTVTLYRELPWFEIRTTLNFEEPAQIGDYFDDRTKLHFAWPLRSPGAIRHAVGGWPATASTGRSFIAGPWLDAGGIAICLFGARKCWVDGQGSLRCVAAWGHDGNRFHNRQGPLAGIMEPLAWGKPMDLRLRGCCEIRYAVWPHGGSARAEDISSWAGSLMMSPKAQLVKSGGGTDPWSKTLVSLRSPGIVPLSVRQQGGGAVVRAMEIAGAASRARDIAGGAMKLRQTSGLDGTPVDSIGHYAIFEMHFTD